MKCLKKLHAAQVSGTRGLLWFSLEALENTLLVTVSSPRYAGCLREELNQLQPHLGEKSLLPLERNGEAGRMAPKFHL